MTAEQNASNTDASITEFKSENDYLVTYAICDKVYDNKTAASILADKRLIAASSKKLEHEYRLDIISMLLPSDIQVNVMRRPAKAGRNYVESFATACVKEVFLRSKWYNFAMDTDYVRK